MNRFQIPRAIIIFKADNNETNPDKFSKKVNNYRFFKVTLLSMKILVIL